MLKKKVIIFIYFYILKVVIHRKFFHIILDAPVIPFHEDEKETTNIDLPEIMDYLQKETADWDDPDVEDLLVKESKKKPKKKLKPIPKPKKKAKAEGR